MEIDLVDSTKLVAEKISLWYESAIKNIPNLIVALVILLFFLLLAKIIKRITARILARLTRHGTVRSLLTTIVHFSVIVLGFFVALEVLNLDKAVTSILASAGIIGLALGFAFQEIASNFIAGILIAFREPYQLKDIVEIDNYFGEVTGLSLRTTSITTFQGLEVIIPNKDMFTKPFINYTSTPHRRIDLKIGVSYGDSLKKVEEVTTEALINLKTRLVDHEIEVFFTEFGESSINLEARFWVEYPGRKAFLKARHEAIVLIKEYYDNNGITIPFPIRTLDFGIKGGKDLGHFLK